MKKVVVFLLFLLIALTMSAVNNIAPTIQYGEVIVTDAVSGTMIKFPKAYKLDSSDVNFEKARLYTPKSVVSVYSMPHPDDMAFTWKRVNEFDANNKYGIMLKKSKLENVDGWVRYYSSTDKQGRPIIKCAILIRGNAYALYVLETAYEIDDCVSPSIIASTEFKKIKGKRIENDGSLTFTFWVITLIAMLSSGLGKLIFGRKISASICIMGGAVVVAYALGLFFWLSYGIGTTLFWTCVTASMWIGVILASSWSDFFNFMEKVFEKMGK